MFCEYGCGREATYQMSSGKWCCEDFYTKCPSNRVKYGRSGKDNHNFNKRPSEESIQKTRAANLGSHRSEETREKLRLQKLGPKNPNYKSGKFPEKALKKILLNPSMKGKKHKKESIEKMRLQKIGPKNPNYGKKQNEDWINKVKTTKTLNGNRTPDHLIPLFELYQRRVYKFTYQSIQLKFSESEFSKIGPSGTKGSYHVDHIFSIYEGFKNGILPSIIGHPCNLRLLPWEENNRKWIRSEISIDCLIKLIKEYEEKMNK